jgi:hypothetical protein
MESRNCRLSLGIESDRGVEVETGAQRWAELREPLEEPQIAAD